MSSSLLFLDTECTGLGWDADVWEVAAVRRDPDGSKSELHLLIHHDLAKCAELPEPFKSDHASRYPHGDPIEADTTYGREDAVRMLVQFAGSRSPHLVGAVPSFDDIRLTLLLAEFGERPPWYYHLIDVENLAVGWLAGRYAREMHDDLPPGIDLPWDSNKLSLAIGVDPDQFERHTAMGDVRWAMAIYDRLMGIRPASA